MLASFVISSSSWVGLDQWTKGLVVAHLKNGKPYVIWDGVFEFFYSQGTAALLLA